MTDASHAPLKRTPLHDRHLALGARMVPFAGYEMPVQYADGVLKEHLHTRTQAGLFDVSHMGQVAIRPKSGDLSEASLALEALVPADILGLKPGRQRYGLFTNADGGILDDLMIANRSDHLHLVVNASRKAEDLAHLRAALSERCDVVELSDRALLALQGPEAETVLAGLAPEVAEMRFMDVRKVDLVGADCLVLRSGYTGEDGFEISVPTDAAGALWDALLADERVRPIGLGARDSLRLEAGLCLYGNDLDEATSPVEAALEWAIQKVRREGGARAGGFPGAERILREFRDGPARRRVGLAPEGRAPIRAGAPIFAEAEGGEPIGTVTSGSFGPSREAPVAMAYLPTDLSEAGTRVFAEVRGKRLPATVASLPFVPTRYKR
ncbi:glycine cleavage system aminomethyltransferase GcvT [Aurantimonas sp. VKM B-3413]|uniref:glycine cleavage system aminomethyltransferase GcvT n=1 Tax=Aurantimonas sp. VKM B-3413 TaxID=2779401 RepID=UPI001E29FABF|nr:glycine cleavage system aminomethyltransferase GcvT [Aurantimonas sp. VKM B-3413]MCB8836755.1 glycine cleavage system aminomethyltransferase GcvT [Aurantimonas sp. VKM B-3413]